jgi:hypothetical protein
VLGFEMNGIDELVQESPGRLAVVGIRRDHHTGHWRFTPFIGCGFSAETFSSAAMRCTSVAKRASQARQARRSVVRLLSAAVLIADQVGGRP